MAVNSYEMSFYAWFNSKKFRHFNPGEILIHTLTPPNSEPPPDLWENIVPTLRILDELRDYLGRPIVISSCYRNAEYNRRVGGTPNSQHIHFKAIDFSCSGSSPNAIRATLLGWRRQGKWTGGLGTYMRITHIDTRPVNVSWRGNY